MFDMPENLKTFEKHQHIHDELVRSILKRIAEEKGRKYDDFSRLFRNGRPKENLLFLDILHKEHPGKFCGVWYCMGCKKYSLDETGL